MTTEIERVGVVGLGTMGAGIAEGFARSGVQRLVEVITTELTDDATLDHLRPVLRTLGKTPIACGDRAGFIVNALLISYLNRAVVLYADGFASRDDLDRAMVEQGGYPQGPLALLDLIGLDVAAQRRLFDETAEPGHRPARLLEDLAAADDPDATLAELRRG